MLRTAGNQSFESIHHPSMMSRTYTHAKDFDRRTKQNTCVANKSKAKLARIGKNMAAHMAKHPRDAATVAHAAKLGLTIL